MTVHVIDVRPEARSWFARCGQPLGVFSVAAADAHIATCQRCRELVAKGRP